MNELEYLFIPIRIGDMELKNRIVMAPMGTGFAAEDGSVTQQLIDYYVERAKGGVGLIIVEACCIDAPEGRAGFSELIVDNDKYIPGLSRLVDAIHAQGAKVLLQLAHAGRYGYSRWTGIQPVAPSPIPSRYTKEMPRELSTAEVEAIIEKFAQGARRAKEAGFDGVELMGSTGYLISQFMSSLTNKRTDRFGGDTSSRATFVVEIIHSIREKVGFPICCKFSVDEYLPGGNTVEDSKIIARRMGQAGVSMLHAWAGWHESPEPMLPMSVKRGAFVPLAEAIKGVASVPVIAVGRINDPRLAAQIIKDKRADLVAMGRPLLADPYLPKKAAAGDLADIRMCIACCRCFDVLMEAMRRGKGEQSLVCALNAELGREGEKGLQTTSLAKKVLIVGGGPAGMEAARVCAIRGHKVTLWDKSDRLGGKLILAQVPPYKEEISNLISYLSYQMQKLGVGVELNKEVTPQSVLDEKADEVIIATGASPLIPDISGVEKGMVISALDVLRGEDGVGEKVVVIGGGMVGCETGEFLASKGKKVTILARRERIGQDIGPTTRWVVLKRLYESGIEISTSTQVESIADDGIIVNKDGETRKIEADSVVLARGLVPDQKLWEALKDKLPQLHLIGDCFQVNKILEAIHRGWEVGCKV